MTSQFAAGVEEKEENSISPFSSSSSCGDDQSYQSKYLHEKERNRKLNDRLAGYKTVVNLFSKEQEEKSKLEKQLRILEREILEHRQKNAVSSQIPSPPKPNPAQGFEQVFTDLEHQPRSRTSSKWTSASSPSFIVIDHHGNERSLPNSRTVSPASVSKAKPTGIEAGTLPTGRDTQSAFVVVSKKSGALIGASSSQSQQPLYPQIFHSQKSTEALQTQFQPSLTNQSNTPLNPQPKNCNNLNCPNTLPEESTKAGSPLQTNIRSLPNQPTSQPLQIPLCSRSQSTSSGGLVTITAWGGQTVKSNWQMEQETLSRAKSLESTSSTPHIQMYQHLNPSQYNHSPANWHNDMETFPRPQENPTFAHSALTNGIAHQYVQGQITNGNDPNLAEGHNTKTTAFSADQPPIPTWGVGARPKNNNMIRDVAQVTPLFPQLNGNELTVKTMDTETTPQPEGKQTDVQEPPSNPLSLLLPSTDLAPSATPTTSAVDHSNSSRANIDPMETWVNVGSEDLMKFPSLKSTPSPEEKTMSRKTPLESSHLSDKPVLANPSDEQNQLASQAHSMVEVLKNGNKSGISEMLFKFAETASQMEKKLTEYQALIQRQQVQIQSLNKHNNDQELLQLRLENENLITYINQLKSKNGPGMVQELGWTVMEKPLNTADDDNSAGKVKNLQETNAKLFQANKEWHSKWEALRQHTMDEKKALESKVQSYMQQMEKLRRDVSTMETQLSEAYAARQEANQKNIQLEQEKLILLKKYENLKAQSENLPKETRRLEAEIHALKMQNQASASKFKESELMGKTNEQLRSEIALLKQQLSVFHEDFQKEREDRTKAEGKAEKLRKERETMKAELISKMKKSQAMLKTKDEDIKQKTKQLADLQYQVDDLTHQLQREKRHSQQSKAFPTTNGLYPSGGTAPIYARTNPVHEAAFNHTYPLTRPAETNVQQQPSSHLSPEHLPGAWQCHKCTYINFPERSICDICGWHNVPGNSITEGTDPSGRAAELKSRGQFPSAATDVPDVVIDTEVDEGQAS